MVRTAAGALVEAGGLHLLPANIDLAGGEVHLLSRTGREYVLRQALTPLLDDRSCQARTRTTLVDLGLRLLSLSVWLPGRRHNHWMRCPNCHQHTWCRIGWTE